MKIINHRLHDAAGKPVPFRASPNVGGELRPRWLLMHYTAGASARQSIDWLCDPASKVSAHLVIGRDGAVTQLVPFDRVAWHAGTSAWKGIAGLNSYSIGIELDGYGYLGTRGAGKWRFVDRPIPDADVLLATHKHGTPSGGWAKYPQVQLDAAAAVAAALVEAYGLEDVLGHDDVSPGRKQDPGPAFPMEGFRARVMARTREAPPAGAGAVPRIGVAGVPT